MSAEIELPIGWVHSTLEDVADIHDNLREPVNSSERAKRHGPYPYYGATGQVGWIDDYRQDGEYVLLGEDGAPFFDWSKEKAYLASGKCWVNNHAHVLKGKEGLCLNRYLLYALNQTDYRGYANGTTRLKLTQSAMRQIPVNLAPPAEQHRIVAKIEELFSELDKGIENLKTAREQLKVYRQALLKHAFEGKLTVQWREQHAVTPAQAGVQPNEKLDSGLRRNDEPLETAAALLARIQTEREQRYQQQLQQWENKSPSVPLLQRGKTTGAASTTTASIPPFEKGGLGGISKPKAPKPLPPLTAEELAELPELPEGWVGARLGWMTCGVEYGTAAKSSESGACPVLRMGNIQNGRFDWTDLVYTDDEAEIAKYMLRDGDVLFNRTNSPELVGKSAIFKSNQPALFAGYLIRVNQIPTIADGSYLNYFLNSHIAKQHGNTVKTDGVNQSNINGEKLVNYPFPFCSLEEQKEIVAILDARLSEADQLELTLTASLQQSESLRQSILKKAFSGQLVAQDADDEPAAALLARIRAERMETTTKTKRTIT